jgi:hypothetical protein
MHQQKLRDPAAFLSVLNVVRVFPQKRGRKTKEKKPSRASRGQQSPQKGFQTNKVMHLEMGNTR